MCHTIDTFFSQILLRATVPFMILIYYFLFRINEKVSTPTSVVLMAINSLFGKCRHHPSDIETD